MSLEGAIAIARGESGEAKMQADLRNEEKIGKRVIRRKNNRGELGWGGAITCMWEIRQCITGWSK